MYEQCCIVNNDINSTQYIMDNRTLSTSDGSSQHAQSTIKKGFDIGVNLQSNIG